MIKESRGIISLCSKSIVSVHTSNFSEAKKLRAQAGRELEALRRVADTDLTKYILVPEQEYVECSVMISVSTLKAIPLLGELGVKPASYILGLLDAIGELKRIVYDDIRQGKLSSADHVFSTMEALYTMISPFAVYDNIVQGVKRKLDVARMLIEDTRSTITEEARREEFVSALNELSSKLGTRAFLRKSAIRKDSQSDLNLRQPEENKDGILEES
ncbi:MAG: RNA-binding protein [Nitrososphaerales archaeon]